MIVATVVAMGVALWVDAMGIGYRYGFVSVYFFGSVGIYYVLDTIDTRMKRKQTDRFDSIKHRMGMDYKKAA